MKILLAVSLVLVSLGSVATAQAALPDAPQPKDSQHRFFDVKNMTNLGIYYGLLAGDLAASKPHIVEHNPIARPFIRSTAGDVFLFTLSASAVTGLTFYAHHREMKSQNHKRFWHVTERAIPIFGSAIEGFEVIHNVRTPVLTAR